MRPNVLPIALADALPKAQLMGEAAAVGDVISKAMTSIQYTPDKLLSRKKFAIYQEMLNDDAIEPAIEDMKILALSTGWTVSPASDDARHVEQADFVRHVLENVDGGFKEDLKQILGALEIGWSIGELVYEPISLGRWTGMLRLKALKAKNPVEMNLTTDAFDNITPNGVINISYQSGQYAKEMPLEKFVVYSYNTRYEDKFGRSKLRCLYELWFMKQIFKKAWAIYLEKFGHGIGVFKNVPADDEKVTSTLLGVLRQLRYESGITVPSGIDFDIIESSGKGADLHQAAIDHIDRRIRIAIAGQTLTADIGDSGSRAAAEVHADKQDLYVAELHEDLAQKAIGPQIIKRIVDMNFGQQEQYPIFRFNPTKKRDFDRSIDKYNVGVEKGYIKPTPADVAVIREHLGFPKGEEDEAFLSVVAKKPASLPKIDPAAADNPDEDPDGEDGVEDGLKQARKDAKAKKDDGDPAELAESRGAVVKLGRKLTKFEEFTDFATIQGRFGSVSAVATSAMARAVREAVADLLEEIARKRIIEDRNIGLISKLSVRAMYVRDLRNAAEDMMLAMQRYGQRDGRSEVRGIKASLKVASLASPVETRPVTPKEVLQLLQQRAYSIAGSERDQLMKVISKHLIDAVQNGASLKDVADAVERDLDGYVARGVADEEDAAGSHIETLVRTEMNRAYNQGRRDYFEEDGADVVAYQYSAILDDRTTELCQWLDGKVYAVTSPWINIITPPNHFNERSLLIPILKGQEWEESPAPPKWVQDQIAQFKTTR